MIPYFEQPVWQLGPLSIHAFGVAVAVAMWVGLEMAQRRFARLGLDPVLGNRLGRWVLGGGIIGAHLFAVVFYSPHELRDDPWILLRIWDPISSFGGILGGVAGALVFFATRTTAEEQRLRWAYVDAIAFVFPVTLAIGRFGCALAHDHPGSVTSFPLAISLESGAAQSYIGDAYGGAGLALPGDLASLGFHDLGWYEFLFLALVVVPLFLYWNRSVRPRGFYLVAFAATYLPVRFGIDFLRVADVRYLGLTPAQWVAALVLAGLPYVALRHRPLRFALSAAVILATGWACWGG